jgi:DNA-binding transcriptional ArsR family regulator
MSDLSKVFEALANEHRREIVLLLALQPRSISQLAQIRGLTLPAIHKHIGVLESAELVSRRKVGRTTYLALRREPLLGLQGWTSQLNPAWGTDMETLTNYTESLTRERPSSKEAP